MDISKLAEAHSKTIADLDKRLTAKPTASLVSKLSKESLSAQVGRIDARIASLEEQKKRTVTRLNQAIARERKALEAIRKEQPDIDFEKLLASNDYAGEGLRRTGVAAKPAKRAAVKSATAKAGTAKTTSRAAAAVKKSTAGGGRPRRTPAKRK